MSIEQLRAEFEAWAARIGLCVTGKYAETINGLCAESAFKAGYKAALQSQDREQDRIDAKRYRWLRADNAYFPEENYIRGGQELDEAIDHARRVEGEL